MDKAAQLFGPEIWTVTGDPLRMFGLVPFTTRMTVVRLANGALWIHSPVAPNAERLEAIKELGQPAHIVAPNKIHSLWVEPMREAFPQAKVWVSPGFPGRHPTIARNGLMDDTDSFEWSDDIDHQVIGGHAFLDEVAFLHKASRTLILTDMIQKHAIHGDSWFWRMVKRAGGVLGREGGVPLDIRLSVRDKPLMRDCMSRVLEWDFDRLIIAHGSCVESGAKAEVTKRFTWLLKG